MRSKIWCNLPFSETQLAAKCYLEQAVSEYETAFYDDGDSGRQGVAREKLIAADIAFGAPDVSAVMESKTLRFVQLFSAGYAAFDDPKVRDDFIKKGRVLANSSPIFNEPCSEHLAAMILAVARQLPQALAEQNSKRRWRQAEFRSGAQILAGQRVVIFGFGAIGARLAEILAALKMQVVGVRRHPKGNEAVRTVPVEQGDAELAAADHIINVLPGGDQTHMFFSAERFARAKEGAVYYSIGRGSTTDQKALRSALQTKKLSAAFLDVTEPEPLAPEDPLWTTPNCYITPHIASGSAHERFDQIDLFLSNLKRFEAGEDLEGRIF